MSHFEHSDPHLNTPRDGQSWDAILIEASPNGSHPIASGQLPVPSTPNEILTFGEESPADSATDLDDEVALLLQEEQALRKALAELERLRSNVASQANEADASKQVGKELAAHPEMDAPGDAEDPSQLKAPTGSEEANRHSTDEAVLNRIESASLLLTENPEYDSFVLDDPILLGQEGIARLD
ncbi:MAG: hypothetical protein M3R68_10250, partial [Acidobacteriota bacterium]|nr:hypothetical protein [Acidobacteriota bacterium]